MSFTRTKTDNCSYQADLRENVSYAPYNFDTSKYANCQQCIPELGLVGGTAVSHVSGNLVDLESALFGIDRDLSRCPETRYLPRGDDKIQGSCFIKPVQRPVIDTTMKHLPACQMWDYQPSVPHPPAMSLFKCGAA